MKNKIIFKSSSNNYYCYSMNKKQIFLCNPIFAYLLNLSDKSTDIERWIETIKTNELRNLGNPKKSKINYYHSKIKFLTEHGFFDDFKPEQKINGSLTPLDVKTNITELKQIVFETTENCNLKCSYCAYSKFYMGNESRTKKNFSIERAFEIIQFFEKRIYYLKNNKFHEKFTISFYGGEPLVNFSFIKKIVSYVSTSTLLKDKVRFMMTTNGTLLHKYIDFLIQNNFYIAISLDGDKSNNQYRIFKNGKQTFTKVFENIKYIQKKHQNYFRKNVSFLSVLHNKNSVYQLNSFTKKSFDKYSGSYGIATSYLNPKHKVEFNKTFLHDVKNDDEKLYHTEDGFSKAPEIMNFITFLNLFTYFIYPDYYRLLINNNRITTGALPTGTCSPFSLRLFVNVNGEIFPCERLDNRFKLGKTTNGKFQIDEKVVAQVYNHYYDKIRKLCHKCYSYQSCAECMFNIDTIDDNIVICNSFKGYKKMSKVLANKVTFIEDNPKFYFKIIKEAYDV